MTQETLEKPSVVIIGGLSDTNERLKVIARPLAKDHTLSYVSGQWNTPETVEKKIARIRNSLAEIADKEGPLVVFGVSAGGPLTVTAALGEETIEGIAGVATGASPLRAPAKMTRILTLATRAYPVLLPLMERFVHGIVPNLSDHDLANIITFRGSRDWKVPPTMSSIDGATNVQKPTPKHVPLPHQANIVNAFKSPELRSFISARLNPRTA